MVLTIQTFVGKVISLLFNTLSRFLIAVLPSLKYCFYFFLTRYTAQFCCKIRPVPQLLFILGSWHCAIRIQIPVLLLPSCVPWVS